jgi:hypothetical protein
MIFRDGRVTTEQRHKLVALIFDGAIPPEQRQLTDRAFRKGWPETCVDELDETGPRRWSSIELNAVVPDLSVIEEIEGSHLHPLVLRSAVHLEVVFTAVEPWHGVAGTVEFWKFNFVRCVVVPFASVVDVDVRRSAAAPRVRRHDRHITRTGQLHLLLKVDE